MKNIVNKNILSILFIALPLNIGAQKITLGSMQTKDGTTYSGEMVAGKPHGKGKADIRFPEVPITMVNGVRT